MEKTKFSSMAEAPLENGQILAGSKKCGCAIGMTGRRELKMKVIPCMYRKNGNDFLYAICHPLRVEVVVSEMNERLKNEENKYNGLELNGIEYFYAGEAYDEDFSLYD